MQAFFLMQVPETRDLGEAVGFGAAVLFAAIFGKTSCLICIKSPMVPGCWNYIECMAKLHRSISRMNTVVL